jgi:hypothetical protein
MNKNVVFGNKLYKKQFFIFKKNDLKKKKLKMISKTGSQFFAKCTTKISLKET